RQRWLDNDFAGMTWSLRKQFAALDFMAGGSSSYYEGHHFGKIIWQNYNILPYEPFDYYEDQARKSDQNIFVKANWNFTERWFLMGDAQLRYVDYSFTGNDVAGNPLPSEVALTFFNPKVGITFVPNTWHRFHLYAGVGQKEPVRDDYLASTPNSRPEPELLFDYEAGYRYNGHRTACGVNVYFMDYARQLVLNGSINDAGEYVRESIGNSYRAGIELDAVWAPVVKWQLQGNLTLSRNRIRNYTDYVYDNASASTLLINLPNTAIAYSPEIIGSALLTWKPVKSLSLTLTGKYVGDQYLDNTENSERKLNDYLVNDLRVEWSPTVKAIKQLTFRGCIYNLTDRMYSANGYTYYGNYYFPQAGINFMGGITVGF
ncbi:MAG: TonB-dependent receptor domain-containing protein, partial [Bacteroidota bacterium]